LNESQRIEAVEAAGEAYLDGIQEYLDVGKSPVSGGKYKSTLADGDIAQLFETGSMRDHIEYRPHMTGGKITGLQIGVFDNAPKIDRLKASGHNKGDSASGVQRQFIPFPSGKFKRSIESEAKSAVREIRQEAQETNETFENNEVSSTLDVFSDSAIDSLIASVLSGEI